MADARRFSFRPGGTAVALVLLVIVVVGTLYSVWGPV